MKVAPVIEEQEEVAEEAAGIEPNDLLQKGAMLCEMGESLIAAAKAMGADSGEGEDVYAEEEAAPAPLEDAVEDEDIGARKRGLIALITKKLK